MLKVLRLASVGLSTACLVAWGDEPLPDQPRAGPSTEEIIPAEHPPALVPSEVAPIPQPVRTQWSATPLPQRGRVCNPPSTVINGPLVRRTIPSRYARPFNRGAYRYEPHIGDIRRLPRDLTLPGSEGARETLFALPPRDRGYFVLPRY